MKNLIFKSNSNQIELAAMQSSKSYSTRIDEVVIEERDEIELTITRPTTGTGINYGGKVYVFDEDGKQVIAPTDVPGSNSPATVKVQNSKLDFTSDSYLIGYGPNNVDQGVNATAATVRIDAGEIFDFNSSRCFKLNATNNRVTARYTVPSEFTQISSMRMYLVKGSDLQDSNKAVGGVIHKFSSSSHNSGTVNLEYQDGTLEVGVTYTVCLNVYSWTRQIAGQTFTFN
ncbi:hypothetical protein [Kordia sp.]|uniref:hypothetical protein n=1 Tax=Kordia sp. TaxID=1965332 RepID=UPI003B5A8B34